MALAHEFEYSRPSSLAEALRLLAEYQDRAKVLAGGTDLIVNIKEGMLKPELLIDVKDIPELRGIKQDGPTLRMGAAVTFCDLIASDEVRSGFQMLWDAARTVASVGVRSRATLAGNICSAVPSLDSAPPLLCYGAVVHCASARGQRDISSEDFFLGPRKTALAADELVTAISVIRPAENNAGLYLKLGRYGGEDLAQAGWGFLLTESRQYRIAHCALAPKPARAKKIEAVLNGQPLTPQQIDKACALVSEEISPITDIRSAREYRLHMSEVMLRRGLRATQDRFEGKDVDPAKLLGGTA